jgi:hypothetical protein
MAVEQLFPSFKSDFEPNAFYDPSDPDFYRNFIDAMIKDSRDYEATALAKNRDQAQRYYYGYLPNLSGDDLTNWGGPVVPPDATLGEMLDMGAPDEQSSKSSFISTDVRDAIMLTLPSLIRLFDTSENVVSLIPRTEADVPVAEQQTNYINYVFWQDNPGFLILHGAFKDAMTVKAGFVKWWTDDSHETKTKTFVNINRLQIQMLQQQDRQARIIHLGDQDELGNYDTVVFQYQVDKPIIKVAGVPPEEMRLDRNAATFSQSRIVGHERMVPIDRLVAMGYDRDLCLDHLQGMSLPDFTMEDQLRNPGRYTSTRASDGVHYGEWYIKADKDGDGVAELRYICTMGEDHEIVRDEPANRIKFACFLVDPIPHTIIGDSLTDYTKDIQRIKTNMMRNTLDSLAASINPRTVINQLMVNVDDALNDDPGAVIRTNGDPNNSVAFSVTPFAGQQVMPVIDYLNDVLARRTGLTDAAKGLDPKALQSSTSIGVEAIINGAQERIELTARILAQTGFKELFTGLYNEIAEAPNQRRTLRINGKWADVDTGTFDASMGVEVNSTLGKGSDQVRMMTLQQIKQDQMAVFTQFGPQNPVVGIPEMLNTITDMAAIANIKNIGRYFKSPPPEVLQQIQSQPKEPDAMTIAARAQFEKVKAEAAQGVGDQQLQLHKQQQDDAYRHAQLAQKAWFEQQKIQVDRAKAGLMAAQGQTPEDTTADHAKVAADVHATNVKGATDFHDTQTQAQLAREKMLNDYQIAQMKADQARQAAEMSAETAMATAAMKPKPESKNG